MARLIGNNRDNRINGTDDDDLILGQGGDDRLFGRGDSDVLDGGRGDDVMTGGGDDDRFIFRSGRDIITDFQPDDDDGDDDDDDDDDGGRDDDGDVIDLRGLAGVDSFSDVRDAARQRGDDLVLRFGDDTQLKLLDTRWADLDRDDFLL